MLERCCSRGVRGDRAADERAIEGRDRRVIEADTGQCPLQFFQWQAGADAKALSDFAEKFLDVPKDRGYYSRAEALKFRKLDD